MAFLLPVRQSVLLLVVVRCLTPKRTRPYTPRTNGKAERFIKTLLAEWAYSMPFQTSGERNQWLPRYLAI
nr:integrase core domain-containing protein [Synechococcus sp. A15-44]